MFLKNGGNVGIGTTSPDGKLDVRGTIFVNGDGTGGRLFASGGNLSLSDGHGRQVLRIDDPGAGSSHTHVFDSNGRLGIGTSSPATLLEVSGDTPILRVTGTSSTPARLDLTSAGVVKWSLLSNDVSSALTIEKDDTAQFTVDTSGNVGIGTTSPGALLHVKTTTSKTDSVEHMLILEHLSSETTTTGVGTGIRFRGERNNGVMQNIGDIEFEADVNSGSTISAALVFKPGLAGVVTERLRIDSSGQLTSTTSNNGQIIHTFKNMDTTTSSSAMTVEQHFNFNRTGGGVNVSAARIVAGKEREWVGAASNQDGFLAFHTCLNETPAERVRITSAGNLHIGSSVNNQFGHKLCIEDTTGAVFYAQHSAADIQVKLNLDSTNNVALFGTVSSDDLQFVTANANALRIDSSGNVGIGTISPAENLHLGASGADQKRSIKIDGTNGSSELQGVILESDGENARFNIKMGIGGGTPSTKLTLLSGGGLTFNGDTSTNNALDDYEEGTFTPTCTYSGGGNATLSLAKGNYTKVGRMVHCIIAVTFSAKGGGSGNLLINNLPFTSAGPEEDGLRHVGTMAFLSGFSSLSESPNLHNGGATTTVTVTQLNSGSNGTGNVTRNNCTDSSSFRASVIFYV